MRILATGCCLLALSACQREKRDMRPAPANMSVFADGSRQSELQPGGPQSQPSLRNPYDGSAYAIAEGKRLFGWYNCSGCHANGGGGIGPPLIKEHWIYGGEPANIFDTIVKGRPNGMPSWGGRIPEYQIWQLAAFVLSLNNKEPPSATPTRGDSIESDPGTLLPKPGGVTK
jgi:cytochrome c oxidase cbb3-type subunit III